MSKYFLFILFIFASINFSIAQNSGDDIRLAFEYYNSKDFDKAEVLFKKIFDKSSAKVYFTYYADCLIMQSKFELAEKEIKKQIRKHKNDPTFLIELGYMYKVKAGHVSPENISESEFMNNDSLVSETNITNKKASDQFEKALKKISPNPSVVRSTANSFTKRREYEYAEKTYKRGRLITAESYRGELANLFAVQRKFEQMIDEYLDWLKESSQKLEVVQNRMQYFINKDINDEFSNILRRQLIKRIQKQNASIVFNKMLVWYYMQRKEFSKALFQAKAIDKRINSSGRNIFSLANTAKSNEDYETALNAYEYIINKGRNRPLYIEANVGRLNVYYLKVVNGLITEDQEIVELEESYLSTLRSLGVSYHTIQSVLDLAHLQTFYLNKPKEGEDLMAEAINLKGLPKDMVAMCKIQLGDILVFQNDLNYAALIYGQAENENKGNSLGDIAKLKKAKLAYYANNFKWAKAQFDALKQSTSKPVANDALYYSIMISDNTEGDSLQSEMKTYGRAELLVFRHKRDSALIVLDSLIAKSSGHQIIDEAYFLKAKIYEEKKNYIGAEKYYKKIITEYSWDILVDLAMFNLAVLYEEKLGNEEEAAEYFKKLMLEYPDSIYVTDARRRYRAIRDKES